MKFRVAFFLAAVSGAQACTSAKEPPTALPDALVTEVGRLTNRKLNESSGIVASTKQPGVLWAHNDGDDGALYAIRRDGSLIARVTVNEKFRDWEDIAADDEGNLYLADTGNNSRDRKRVMVYRVAEPDPASTKEADVEQVWKLGFPEKPFDCESLFIWQGHGYVISKHDEGQRNAIYRFPLTPSRRTTVLEKVVELPVDEPVTAADLSRDGRRLAVLSREILRVFSIEGKIEAAADASIERFKVPPVQAEGCCFVPDGVLVTAETGEIFLAQPASPATQPASPSDGKPAPPSPPASGQIRAEARPGPVAPTR